MGRGQGAELLFGTATRSAGEKASARRHQLRDDFRLSFTKGWSETAGLLIEARDEVLADSDWARGLIGEVAASLPRGERAPLDPELVSEEIRQLLTHPEIDAGVLSRCSLGVPDSLLALDDSGEGSAASFLLEKLDDPDCRIAAEVMVESRQRGRVFEMASEALATRWIDESFEENESKAEFLLTAVNGVDLDVWRGGRVGSVLHLVEAGEGPAPQFLCGKTRGANSFYPADRGELRLSVTGVHPEGTKVCPRCLRRAEDSDHPSLGVERISTTPPDDLRDRVRDRALGPVVAAINSATDPEELDEEGLEDTLDAEVGAGLRAPAVRALLELPEEERWGRLMGDVVHRDEEIAACEEWPSFPDHTADRVLDYMSSVGGNDHTRRSKARWKASDIFKVRAGIRDLDAEKREAEEKRRNWSRWDRGRNHTDFALGKELHLFVDMGGEAVFQGAVTPVAACGNSATYDPMHRGNRFGLPKCPDCERIEKERARHLSAA